MKSWFRQLKHPKSLVTCFAALLCVSIASIFTIHSGWRHAASSGIECQTAFQDPLPYDMNPYMEFYLERQELNEPIFDGKFFIDLSQQHGQNPGQLKVTRSGARSYGASTNVANFIWMDSVRELVMTDFMNTTFVSTTGTHRDFPFDSAHFDFDLEIEPWVELPVFRLNNRVPGFEMPCNAVKVDRRTNGTYNVAFDLIRDPLTRLTAILLFVAAAIFAVIITIFVDRKSVATAVASYFFSLWSIRGIFGLGSEGFPTRFDIGILSLCLFMLILLAARGIWSVFSQLRPGETDDA